jgi:hypothetical protein
LIPHFFHPPARGEGGVRGHHQTLRRVFFFTGASQSYASRTSDVTEIVHLDFIPAVVISSVVIRHRPVFRVLILRGDISPQTGLKRVFLLVVSEESTRRGRRGTDPSSHKKTDMWRVDRSKKLRHSRLTQVIYFNVAVVVFFSSNLAPTGLES